MTNQASPVSQGQSEVTEVEVTTFEDAEVTPGYETPMSSNTTKLSAIESTHSIIEFLRRPVLMQDVELKPTDITTMKDTPFDGEVQKEVLKANFPFDLAKTGGKAEKLNRFEYFKTDIVVKITINANNMTSGRFWLTYAPIDAFISEEFKITSKHRAGVTSYPGVEMDIQINNSVEMKIPYLHWAEAMSTTNASAIQSSFATLYLFALTPIRNQSSYPLTVQLWAWFDNVTLVGPTTNVIKDSALSEDDLLMRKFMRFKMNKPRKYEAVKAYMQVGNEARGPITQVASVVSGLAPRLTNIPIIGEVASTVGWLADLVGGVASVFGWSKPVNADPVCRLANIPAYGFTHAEGQDAGTVLGLTPRNELGLPVDTFTTDVDEMDIPYICRNPAVVVSSPWTKTDKSKHPLISLKVAPSADAVVNTTTAPFTELHSVSCCDYVGSLFALWRGTMCYRIAVVKTAYHTGRLEISFVPNLNKIMPDDADTTNTYRYILDITNESEVCIRVPFFSDSYMLNNDGDYSGSVGSLTIRPITTLHCPDVVADTVDILVWKWMEDPIFACPVSADLIPYNNVKPPEPETKVESVTVNAEMQIMVGNVQDSKSVTFFEGEEGRMEKGKILTTVNGEACENLRYLTRTTRYCETLNMPEKDEFQEISPFYGLRTYDYISFIGHLYRYARGGLNIKFLSKSQKSTDDSMQIRTIVEFGSSDVTVTRRAPEHITYTNLNPVHEISIPFYSKYKRVPVVPLSAAGSVGEPILPKVLLYGAGTANGRQLDLYRSGKDDFSFGTLVGPPMLSATANAARSTSLR